MREVSFMYDWTDGFLCGIGTGLALAVLILVLGAVL
jgi:hypothetical protein